MKLLLLFLIVLFTVSANAQIKRTHSKDSLAGHKIENDKNGKLLSWYEPSVPGAAYRHVMKLASEFIRNATPVDPKTGLKLYFISCCFDGPHMVGEEKFRQGKSYGDWLNNPACVFAGMTQSLAIDYRNFTGDDAYLQTVREMLDYQLAHGTTPYHWPWASVPFASADPGAIVYKGGTRWEGRGDGLDGVEPDKIGELGYAYLMFWEITAERKYLDAAIACGDALSKNILPVKANLKEFSTTQVSKSPWPFRVNARTGVVIDDYCSNVIEPIRLLDELIRTENKIAVSSNQLMGYKKSRDIARRWLFSKEGPMKTYIWNAYFEDVANDSMQANRVQITPLETARYLIKHADRDSLINYDVPAILNWVAGAFSVPGQPGIKEQTWCYEFMGSHTARYASVCALWYERTGDLRFKEEAFRNFNFASYMTDAHGVVWTGPEWPQSWFSDGYSDYIKHFAEGLAAIPEWAPAGEDHLLRSSSVIKLISYRPTEISFITFDEESKEVLRLSSKPKLITVNGKDIFEAKVPGNSDAWTWNALNNGGVLRINHRSGNSVKISK